MPVLEVAYEMCARGYEFLPARLGISDATAFRAHEGKVLLSEEKDSLKEAYGIMHCTREQLEQLDDSAIIGKRTNAYGAEVVVKKDAVPAGTELSPVDLEELFVRMVKEG